MLIHSRGQFTHHPYSTSAHMSTHYLGKKISTPYCIQILLRMLTNIAKVIFNRNFCAHKACEIKDE